MIADKLETDDSAIANAINNTLSHSLDYIKTVPDSDIKAFTSIMSTTQQSIESLGKAAATLAITSGEGIATARSKVQEELKSTIAATEQAIKIKTDEKSKFEKDKVTVQSCESVSTMWSHD